MVRTQVDAPPRDVQIRALFARLGPMSTLAIARACVEEGIYSQEDLELMHLRTIQGDVREALKKPDAVGLPLNGHTTERDDDGAPVWKARQMWLFADYELNIRDHIKQRDAEHHQAVKLNEECEERFGERVAIEALV